MGTKRSVEKLENRGTHTAKQIAAMAAAYWGEPAFLQPISKPYMKSLTVGDINSFFMLFFDNFSSLLAILAEMIFIPLIVLEFNPMGVPVGVGDYSTTTVAEYYDANAAVVWGKVCPGI